MRYATGILVLTSAVAIGADAPGRGQPILPPAPVRTFGMESRPIWDRPTSDGLTLQKQTEAAVDRGNGTVQDANLFQLNLLELQNAGATQKQLYEAQQYRAEQIEQLRLQASRQEMREKRYESEAVALAKERSAWASGNVSSSGLSGAVVDRQALDAIESTYRSAIATATTKRDAALAQAGNDRAARDAAARTFESEKASAIQARTTSRDLVFGGKK